MLFEMFLKLIYVHFLLSVDVRVAKSLVKKQGFTKVSDLLENLAENIGID